jgi:hypothetical protein
MGGHEAVPPEILKTLTGWKKHFNSYTNQGRLNVSQPTPSTRMFPGRDVLLPVFFRFSKTVIASLSFATLTTLYLVYGRGGSKKAVKQ